jgi:Tol biopolymer transport system component
MSDQRLRDLGVCIEDATPIHDFDHLVSRARRHVAMRRAAAMAAACGVVAAAVFAVEQVGDPERSSSPPPADRIEQDRDPWCTKDRSTNCVDISGWIVYGDHRNPSSGLWAVDPTEAGDPANQVQLSDDPSDTPLGWSPDGTKLLIRRSALSDPRDVSLIVLNADGTENELWHGDGIGLDGSFSPDGSQVIYAWLGGGGIYTVDSDGGTPQLLLAPVSRHYPGEEGKYLGALYGPVFSPDGKQIAYFDGMGDWGNSLRVMRSDGTSVRVLWEDPEARHIGDLAWSPDGRRLMFAFQHGAGVWTIGVDGSDLTQVVAAGLNPAWSPDGTRISYQVRRADLLRIGPLRIADVTGEHVTKFSAGGSGPWNPLPLGQ